MGFCRGVPKMSWRLAPPRGNLRRCCPVFFRFSPYSTTLASELGIPVDSIGLSGFTSDELLRSLELPTSTDCFDVTFPGALLKIRSGFPPSAVLVMGGTNDLGGGRPADVVAALVAIHRAFHDAGVPTYALSVRTASTFQLRFSCVSAVLLPASHLIIACAGARKPGVLPHSVHKGERR